MLVNSLVPEEDTIKLELSIISFEVLVAHVYLLGWAGYVLLCTSCATFRNGRRGTAADDILRIS